MRVAEWHKAFQGGSTKQNPRHTAAPDLLARDFTAVAPNTKWVADLTRILTGEGVLWLASVRDAFSKKVVGWDSGPRATTDLVVLSFPRFSGDFPIRFDLADRGRKSCGNEEVSDRASDNATCPVSVNAAELHCRSYARNHAVIGLSSVSI